MVMKHVFLAVGAGLISGFLVLASLSGTSVAVAYLSLILPLPLFISGLGLGLKAASIAVVSGVVFALAGNPMAAVAFVVLFAAPAWLITSMALRGPHGVIWEPREQDRGEIRAPHRAQEWFSVGTILAVVACLAGAFIVAASVWSGGGLEQAVKLYLNAVAAAIVAPQGQDVLRAAIKSAAPFFPGAVAAFWAMSLLLNAALAQGILAKGGNNLRPSPRFKDLWLPDGLSWALVGAALLALIASGELEYIGRNLVLVLGVPFFFLGLAVVHSVVNKAPFPAGILALVYVVMIFTGWFVLVIAGLGMLEQWAGLRAHMKAPGSGLED